VKSKFGTSRLISKHWVAFKQNNYALNLYFNISVNNFLFHIYINHTRAQGFHQILITFPVIAFHNYLFHFQKKWHFCHIQNALFFVQPFFSSSHYHHHQCLKQSLMLITTIKHVHKQRRSFQTLFSELPNLTQKSQLGSWGCSSMIVS